MREARTFTVLAVTALILVMAAILATPAQARTARDELEFKSPPRATPAHESSDAHWVRRTRTVGGAAAMVIAAGALSLAKAATS